LLANAVELGQFVEEQHAVVGERSIARPLLEAAATSAAILAQWCGLRNAATASRNSSN